jgi:4-hydroxy-2-oxoglutarate aldolase
MYKLWMAGHRDEAERLQVEVSRAEIGFGMGGINGTKWVVAKLLGYAESSSHCRRPYPILTDVKQQSWILSKAEILKPIEAALTKS